jgi:regulatory helix-turn-helix LysR family protein
MDLGDLHIFRTVVQAGGVTRAAERLNRVQSNVTTRVRQLEADLGVELFVRDGKKLHLHRQGGCCWTTRTDCSTLRRKRARPCTTPSREGCCVSVPWKVPRRCACRRR